MTSSKSRFVQCNENIGTCWLAKQLELLTNSKLAFCVVLLTVGPESLGDLRPAEVARVDVSVALVPRVVQHRVLLDLVDELLAVLARAHRGERGHPVRCPRDTERDEAISYSRPLARAVAAPHPRDLYPLSSLSSQSVYTWLTMDLLTRSLFRGL